MYLINIIKRFANKYPRSFRFISYDVIKITNFFLYFLLLPTNLFYSFFLKYKLSKSSNIQKLIIRNDKIGDNILTLPYIYGTKSKDRNCFYFSNILDEITSQIFINNSWQSSKHIKSNCNLFIANLATSDISTFTKYLPKYKSRLIFSQITSNLFSRQGFPLIFSPFYSINKSQTKFVNNNLRKLQVKSDPIVGIKVLNDYFGEIIEPSKERLLIIVLGLGLDKGRQLKNYLIKEIIIFAKKKKFKPVILVEPGFEEKSQQIALENNIHSKSSKNYQELFRLFKSAKYAIGFDCGPMHIASLCTNSIIIFSHAAPLCWGKHIWNKTIEQKIIKLNYSKIFISKQINKGSGKLNWIISNDKRACLLHKKSCENNKCSKLDEKLLIKAIKEIL